MKFPKIDHLLVILPLLISFSLVSPFEILPNFFSRKQKQPEYLTLQPVTKNIFKFQYTLSDFTCYTAAGLLPQNFNCFYHVKSTLDQFGDLQQQTNICYCQMIQESGDFSDLMRLKRRERKKINFVGSHSGHILGKIISIWS